MPIVSVIADKAMVVPNVHKVPCCEDCGGYKPSFALMFTFGSTTVNVYLKNTATSRDMFKMGEAILSLGREMQDEEDIDRSGCTWGKEGAK